MITLACEQGQHEPGSTLEWAGKGHETVTGVNDGEGPPGWPGPSEREAGAAARSPSHDLLGRCGPGRFATEADGPQFVWTTLRTAVWTPNVAAGAIEMPNEWAPTCGSCRGRRGPLPRELGPLIYRPEVLIPDPHTEAPMHVPEDLDRCLVEVGGRFIGIVTHEDGGAVFTALVPEARSLDGARFRSIKAAMRAAEQALGPRRPDSEDGGNSREA